MLHITDPLRKTLPKTLYKNILLRQICQILIECLLRLLYTNSYAIICYNAIIEPSKWGPPRSLQEMKKGE